jgi:epoxyqueuosine reductase QueG
MALIHDLKETIEKAGHAAVIPVNDERFWVTNAAGTEGKRPFSSNWSERHIAYAAGLGTFSLAGGLITSLGTAGRLASLVTSLELPADTRPYTTFNEYCTMCGECAKRCPVHAIRKETGKTHAPCSAFLDKVKATCPPYYGCGKCQSGVPCEDKIPHNIAQ